MSELRVGRIARALRHRLGWRQSDVARRAAVSQDLVSRIELGHADSATLATLRRVLAALDAELWLRIRWRGGELDRLLDEGHASLTGDAVRLLSAHGWDVRVEVSFSTYGDRGSIDLLAWHAATRTLAVGEVKTEIASVEETLRTHDMKVRVGARIAGERFGWVPGTVTRLLVLPDASTTRRRVARHEALFSRTYPLRGLALRAWLRSPSVVAGCMIFLSPTTGVRGIRQHRSRKRIRRSAVSSRAVRNDLRRPSKLG